MAAHGSVGAHPRPNGRPKAESVGLSVLGRIWPGRVEASQGEQRESIKDRPLALWYEHCRFAVVEWDDACGD